MQIQNFNTKKKIFLIAEIGNNHEGDFKIAKKLIFLAKKNGADAVKFQYITPSELYTKKDKKSLSKLNRICLNANQFRKLKKYADQLKIFFLCSVFDFNNIKEIYKSLPAVKVPSGDNNNLKIINELLSLKKPVLFSTGMTNLSILKKILKKINKNKFFNKKNFCLMHCVSNYPLLDSDVNMKALYSLKKLGYEIGYSDHTIGIDACIVAASLGARIIEKHFTLSHNYSSFRDHQLSANPGELSELSKKLARINNILGTEDKVISKNELKNVKSFRRGAYASKDLKIGKKIDFNDIIFLRPEGEINLININDLIGKKLKKKLNKFQEIKKQHFK
jgi:N,N'-diacetyllegionaminate synthase